MQNNRDLLSIGKASEYLGISIDTLRRWEKRGKLKTYRSPGGHRYFERKELDSLFGTKYERDETEDKIPSVIIQEKKVYDEITVESKIIDRPVKDINIPEAMPVKIIKQNPPLNLTGDKIPVNTGVLIPPTTNTTKNIIEKTEASVVKNERKRKSKLNSYQLLAIIFLSIIIILIVGFLIAYLRSPQKELLSPIP